MKRLSSSRPLAALAAHLPAFAHEGMLHDGCAAGQVFAAGDITVTGAFTRATLPNARSARGYLTIENDRSTADRLRRSHRSRPDRRVPQHDDRGRHDEDGAGRQMASRFLPAAA